jgi:hypothetical protein
MIIIFRMEKSADLAVMYKKNWLEANVTFIVIYFYSERTLHMPILVQPSETLNQALFLLCTVHLL